MNTSTFENLESIDLGKLKELKGKNLKNPFLCYLNINSLCNKIVDLRYVLAQTGIELPAVSETKLSENFPDAQFYVERYNFPPYHRDRNSNGGGLMVFMKKDLITGQIKELESTKTEINSLELTVSKHKWIIFSVYLPPKTTNFQTFFSELNICLDKATRTYENIVLLGDINIDTEDERVKGRTKLSEFCDIFDLESLIKGSTGDTIRYPSTSIDVIMTNKKRNFKNSCTVATGISDYHSVVLSMMRANYERLKPMKIQYCLYKNFDEDKFMKDLQKLPFINCKQIENKDAAYDLFKNLFKTIVDQHAPLKIEFIHGTHAPFMNKELSKAIMHKSKLHNMHKKLKTKESWEAFKRQQNKCVSIEHKNICSHFTELAGKCGNCNNKKFWSEIKPFLTNKHSGKGQNIVLSENEIVVRDSTQVAEILNNYFINIVEINTGSKPHSFPCTETGLIDDGTIDEIIDRYSNHPSVTSIKSNLMKNPQAFSYKLASSFDIEKIVSKLSLATVDSKFENDDFQWLYCCLHFLQFIK